MSGGTKICFIEDCESKVSARAMCSGHYMKWSRYGDPLYDIPNDSRSTSIEKVNATLEKIERERGVKEIAFRRSVELYLTGMTLAEVSVEIGHPISTVRHTVKKAGVIRSQAEAVSIARSKGRFYSSRGRKVVFTDEWKENLRASLIDRAQKTALGYALKPSGYYEFTRGEHKGRSVHVVYVEALIGRRLRSGECVHHIDGNKINNDLSNLLLTTFSEHARIHRLQEIESGIERERRKDGTWR